MDKHIDFLKMAIEESNLSVKNASSPFGAVVVKDGKIIAKAHNTVVLDCDATAHAEVNAIRQAGKYLGSFDLSGCVLYTSCEPCPMCLNAIKWSNIKEIYYAADRNDADSIGFRDRVFYEEDVVSLKRIKLDEALKVMQDWYHSDKKKPY